MPALDLLRIFLPPLLTMNFTHMVTGSAAATFYGEPRLTLDIGLVLELSASELKRMPLAFPEEDSNLPPEERPVVESQRPARGHGNIIHHATGLKADLYFAGQDARASWALTRRRSVRLDDLTIHLAPPEYVIVRKLEYFREGGSSKHLRDIRGMLEPLASVADPSLDRAFLDREVTVRGLSAQWERCCTEE